MRHRPLALHADTTNARAASTKLQPTSRIRACRGHRWHRPVAARLGGTIDVHPGRAPGHARHRGQTGSRRPWPPRAFRSIARDDRGKPKPVLPTQALGTGTVRGDARHPPVGVAGGFCVRRSGKRQRVAWHGATPGWVGNTPSTPAIRSRGRGSCGTPFAGSNTASSPDAIQLRATESASSIHALSRLTVLRNRREASEV